MMRVIPHKRIRSIWASRYKSSVVLATYIQLLLLHSLAGCSGALSANTSESLPLPPALLSERWECEQLKNSDRSLVYSCRDGDNTDPLFVTAVRDCSISEKFSHRATTRQLLVGFSNLKILSQEGVSIGQYRVLRSVIAGTLDVEPVYLSTFTLRKGSCVTDLSIWKRSEEANSAVVGKLEAASWAARFSEAATQLATILGSKELFNSVSGKEKEPLSFRDSPFLATQQEETEHAELPVG